jgi:hypothetical protein
LRFLSLFVFFLCVGCSRNDLEPCEKASVGLSEKELIKTYGESIQRSDEEGERKTLMFKGDTLPTIMIVELTKGDDHIFRVSYCNTM